MALAVTCQTVLWRALCRHAESTITASHYISQRNLNLQQNTQSHTCSRYHKLSSVKQSNSKGMAFKKITYRTLITSLQSKSSRTLAITPEPKTNANITLYNINLICSNKYHHSVPINNLNSTQRSLLQVRNEQQHLHHSMSSLSPAQLIMESCPQRSQPYLRLIRFDKPIGTWLLYWPCTWSIALAAPPGSLPDIKLLALFGAGAFFMRGAGCIINDLWDKDYDAKVERTKQRPLACGELSSFEAVVFLGFQLSCALAILLQLNWYSVFLGAASMGLVIAYPLAKRYTYWPQLVLGFTFNYGALLGWAAVQGSNDWAVCLPLYMSCVLWTLVYDTIYAHQDKYDDMLIGVKSTALKFGDQTKPWLYGFTALMCSGLTSAGVMGDMTWPYYMAVSLTCSRLLHQIYSVNLNSADDCAQTFRGNFYLGVVMFTGIIIANLLKSGKQEEKNHNQEAVKVT